MTKNSPSISLPGRANLDRLAFIRPAKVDESSLHISPDELNANSISDIKTLKPSYQFSFHWRVK